MNLTDLEHRALLALLEHGKGFQHTLTYDELCDRLRCSLEELKPVLDHLASSGLGQGAFGQAGLSPEGKELARELQAAPERERQERSTARSRLILRVVRWTIVVLIVGVFLPLLVLYLAKRWGLIP